MRRFYLSLFACLGALVLGCSDDGGDGTEIDIGVVQSLSGDGAVYGRSGIEGIELAIKELEAEDPDLDIDYTIVDDQSSVEGGVEAYEDFVEDERLPQPVEVATAAALERQTNRVLGTLTPREEQVLRLRFGIGERLDHTLEDVGARFAVTRERVRQIESKAIRKLRHPTRSRYLRAFYQW